MPAFIPGIAARGSVEIIPYMPCGEPLLRTRDPRGIRGRGLWLSKFVRPLFSFLFYLFATGYEPQVVKLLRYLKLAYNILQPLNIHTWTSNIPYRFQKLGLQLKRETKLCRRKQLSTKPPVVEGGQSVCGRLDTTRYGYL